MHISWSLCHSMKNMVNPPNTVKTYMIFWWLTCWVILGNASWNSSYLIIFRLRIPHQPKQFGTNINHEKKLQVTRHSPIIQGKKTYMRYASPLPKWPYSKLIFLPRIHLCSCFSERIPELFSRCAERKKAATYRKTRQILNIWVFPKIVDFPPKSSICS